MPKILFIFGTRPEAIKLAPLIKEFRKRGEGVDVKICVTGQHRQLLDQVLDFFGEKTDYDLNLMKSNQTIGHITASGLMGLEKVVEECRPDIIFVHGDTTTSFIGALTGFYHKIKVAHIEAGLRSGSKSEPYPEEMNRTLTGHIADYHFAPTEKAVDNLRRENIVQNVFQVGNTAIDALLLCLRTIEKEGDSSYYNYFDQIDFSRRIILVTGHRRENFGQPFEQICLSLREISERFSDVEIVYPVHLNPNIRRPATQMLGDVNRIHLIDPVNYSRFVWLMDKASFILTDSGGIQEEAPTLSKPVLVMRNVTERVEGIEARTAKLVGTTRETIVASATRLLTDRSEFDKMSKAKNPYGDGLSSRLIVDTILEKLRNR